MFLCFSTLNQSPLLSLLALITEYQILPTSKSMKCHTTSNLSPSLAEFGGSLHSDVRWQQQRCSQQWSSNAVPVLRSLETPFR